MKTWAERIAEARDLGTFTDDDRRDAEQWCSCALGEALRQARLSLSAWCDSAAIYLRKGETAGYRFAECVRRNDFDGAENALVSVRTALISDESLIQAAVEEAKKHAAEPELVKA